MSQAVRFAQQGTARRGGSYRGTASRSIPPALFDVQVKRFHEYKRQLLNILHVIEQYRFAPSRSGVCLHAQDDLRWEGCAWLLAKQIIKLINNVSLVVNNDKRVQDQIKVVFLPNFTSPSRSDHSRRRSQRTDLHGGHRGVRHRQYEVHAQRRADHRNARRRQLEIRDHVGPRQHLHLREHRLRRSSSAAGKGIDARETIAAFSAAARGA